MPVTNALANRQFVSTTYHYNLTGQHQVGDVEYVNFLDNVRYWIPDQNTLDNLQEGCILCPTDEIKPDDVTCLFINHPNISVLTFTNNRSNHINDLLIQHLFRQCEALTNIEMDSKRQPSNVYQGMRVMIMQN